MLLGLRIDHNAFTGKDRRQPFRSPSPFGRIVDMGERLELHAVACLVGDKAIAEFEVHECPEIDRFWNRGGLAAFGRA